MVTLGSEVPVLRSAWPGPNRNMIIPDNANNGIIAITIVFFLMCCDDFFIVFSWLVFFFMLICADSLHLLDCLTRLYYFQNRDCFCPSLSYSRLFHPCSVWLNLILLNRLLPGTFQSSLFLKILFCVRETNRGPGICR